MIISMSNILNLEILVRAVDTQARIESKTVLQVPEGSHVIAAAPTFSFVHRIGRSLNTHGYSALGT